MATEVDLPVRRAYLDALATHVAGDTIVVSAFGDSTRDWAAVADRDLNLYLLGGMGHATSVALGLALALSASRVVCCETDGGLLMNLGSLVTLAGSSPRNLTVVVFNNDCYESSGGQALPGRGVSFAALARDAGIAESDEVRSVQGFEETFARQFAHDALTFLNVRVAPRTTPRESFELHPLEIRERFRAGLRARDRDATTNEEDS
jgi:thiamine pyrophosphate-dependent acetolactate synthase large subunit-like protein